jgi:glycosyltransferase involved in cell wall biosynthesis
MGSAATANPRVLLIYHFFHPDEVVSARLFGDLAQGLAARGWAVDALTSNRSWNDSRASLPQRERWQDVTIHRVFRPAWEQSRPLERLGNSAWLSAAWLARIARLPRHDAVVIGSDPAFAPGIVPALRRIWPEAAVAHWCYDLYPEAIVADGTSRATAALLPIARQIMAKAYASCDAIVDLGPRMRERLEQYPSRARRETIVPWALVEPTNAPAAPAHATRRAIFGDAKLALLYSGTLGRAHDFDTFLALARAARPRFGDAIAFAFACRGNRVSQLRESVRADDTNVRIVDFCDESRLSAQLEAADLHLLSLRAEWSGLVVPSKFFGSLAVGRPVLYAGPSDSDIARIISETNTGFIVDYARLGQTIEQLGRLVADVGAVTGAQRHARAAYDERFRRSVSIDRWDVLLRSLVALRGASRD